MDKLRQNLYYVIIGVITFITLVFLPMIGSELPLGWNLPDTTIGWIVWIVVKLIVSVINVMIFYCFMQQGKLNAKESPSYKEARALLQTKRDKNVIPRSPKKWNTEQYTHKATSIALSTALSTIALTQAVLTFDYMSMLTYLFVIIMGLIFGVMQMKVAEEYWTNEYLEYAKYHVKLLEEIEQEEKLLIKPHKELKEANDGSNN